LTGLPYPILAIEIAPDQEIWVMSSEGAKLTGYSGRYLGQLAKKFAAARTINAQQLIGKLFRRFSLLLLGNFEVI
jgi:hypothetical protein